MIVLTAEERFISHTGLTKICILSQPVPECFGRWPRYSSRKYKSTATKRHETAQLAAENVSGMSRLCQHAE